MKVYVKGTNNCFKDSILIECEGIVDGDSVKLQHPFNNTGININKLKDNSKENPFNFIIAIETYEKALGRENRFKDFYDLFGKAGKQLKDFFNCEIREDKSNDYQTFCIYDVDIRGIQHSVRFSLERDTITRIELRSEDFDNDRKNIVFNEKEFETFKGMLEDRVNKIIEQYKEKTKSSDRLDEARELCKELEQETTTETYELRSYFRDWGDSINLTLRFDCYKIPKEYSDNVKDYKNCFDIHIKITEEEIILLNGVYNVKEKDFENINTIEELEIYLKNTIYEGKSKSLVKKQDAEEEKNRIEEEYNNENKLTEDKLNKIKENYKVGDKVTICGVEGCFGNTTNFKGKIHEIRERGISVVKKGSRTRGLHLTIGDYFKSIEKGYKK